jgi:ankyrin repeat protein
MKLYIVVFILLLSPAAQAAPDRLAKSFDTLNMKVDLDSLKQAISDGENLETIIDNETPLMKAIYYNNLEAIKLLLDAGAQVNGTNQKGVTPLMRAVSPYSIIEFEDRDLAITAQKHPASIEILDILINHGANIDAQNQQGNTALMIAVRSAQPTIVEYLLKHQAKTDLKNTQQKTASQLEGQYKHKPSGRPRASQEKKRRAELDKKVQERLAL